MTKTHSMKIALMLSGVALIALSKGAQAGFEWKGPLEAPPSLPQSAAPAGDDGMSDLAPVTGEAPPLASPVEPPAPLESLAPQAPAAAAAPAQGGDVLAGFGADLPLVMALQQVVPPGYRYSFSGGVNPGVLVSWEGGRPWQAVLTDMLARQGLGYTLHDSTVIVGYHSTPAAAQTASSAAQSEGTDDIPAPIDGTQPISITQQPAAEAKAVETAQAPAPVAEERVEVRREKKPFWKKLAWWQNGDETSNNQSEDRTASAGNQAAYWGDAQNQPAANDRTASGSKLISHPPAPVVSSEQEMAPMPSSQALSAPPAKAADSTFSASADGEAASSAPVQVASAQTAASADTAAATDAAAGNWQGAKGQTLRDVLKRWADKAGVELYWSIDYDYRLTDSVGYPGSFDEAVGRLLDKFAAVRPQPYGQLHQGGTGPRVLVIKSYDLAQ